MSPLSEIKGILFDSGDTLVRPVGGRWWPRPHFRPILAKHGVDDIPEERLREALERGQEYLNAHHHLPTEDEQRQQFLSYYSIVLQSLNLSRLGHAVVGELTDATMAETDIAPFPETPMVLGNLRTRGLRLGVVSNAWPTLERNYRRLGLRQYFTTFVISARLGCTKPDDRIYRHAITEMDLLPEQILFVDDVPQYVDKAIELGLVGLVIARGRPPSSGLPCVSTLTEIEKLLQ